MSMILKYVVSVVFSILIAFSCSSCATLVGVREIRSGETVVKFGNVFVSANENSTALTSGRE